MKLGERIVMSVNGGMAFGVQGASAFPAYPLTTLFQDAPHGAAMQASTFLHLFWRSAVHQRSLPRELGLASDNTTKETKNATCYIWALWLLAVLRGGPMELIRFLQLIVGHTHDALDRFYSRLKAAIRGRDFDTLDELADLIRQAMPAVDISWFHLDRQWQWEEVRAASNLQMHSLRNAHHMEFFRVTGQGSTRAGGAVNCASQSEITICSCSAAQPSLDPKLILHANLAIERKPCH